MGVIIYYCYEIGRRPDVNLAIYIYHRKIERIAGFAGLTQSREKLVLNILTVDLLIDDRDAIAFEVPETLLRPTGWLSQLLPAYAQAIFLPKITHASP